MLLAAFRFLTSARYSGVIFAAAVFVVYCLIPGYVGTLTTDGRYFNQLSIMGGVAALAILVGFAVPLFDWRRAPGSSWLWFPPGVFHFAIWASFVLFLLYTFGTAEKIPLVSAFQGATADELSEQRGALFKGREGVEIVLLYLSAIYVSALLPYSLVKLYLEKSRFRYLCTGIFLVFTVSSLHKAMFVNVALPLLYYIAWHARNPRRLVLLITGGSLALMFIVTVLASGRRSTFEVERSRSSLPEFFAATHVTGSALELLTWRMVAVPVFTATDSLVVFDEALEGKPLNGATSSLIANLTGQQRVLFERMVFAHQWGWNDIANSNAVFFVESYVNFTWTGVILVSLFVGQSLRWIARSRDPAMRSLWLVYCNGLFSGGIFGILLSNGYLGILFLALFIRVGVFRPSSPMIASPSLPSAA